MSRLAQTFTRLTAENRTAFIPFITAGDPTIALSQQLLNELPSAGADIIELGIPFSDPMADGPAIQASSIRSLQNGTHLHTILEMVAVFRKQNQETPIVLMGYFNPILQYGVSTFVQDAVSSGVDAVLVVDLPPEHDSELCCPLQESGVDFIRLLTPTTSATRLPALLRHSSGFLYYVSITGVTGTTEPDFDALQEVLKPIRAQTSLPIVVGFGIKTPDQVAQVAQFSDGVVVGSSIVRFIEDYIRDDSGIDEAAFVVDVLSFVRSLKGGI